MHLSFILIPAFFIHGLLLRKRSHSWTTTNHKLFPESLRGFPLQLCFDGGSQTCQKELSFWYSSRCIRTKGGHTSKEKTLILKQMQKPLDETSCYFIDPSIKRSVLVQQQDGPQERELRAEQATLASRISLIVSGGFLVPTKLKLHMQKHSPLWRGRGGGRGGGCGWGKRLFIRPLKAFPQILNEWDCPWIALVKRTLVFRMWKLS